jgi:putative Mg2+ transporter-C (MgtC) family protein
MACGAGLYAPAAVATIIVIVSLEAVGLLERRANVKVYSLVYEARGEDQTRMLESILHAMDHMNQRLAGIETSTIGVTQRVSFSLTVNKRQHERLRKKLLAEPGIAALFTFFDPEDD